MNTNRNKDASNMHLKGNVALRIAGQAAASIIQTVFAGGDSIRLIGIDNIATINNMKETFFTVGKIVDPEDNFFCNMISVYSEPPQGFTIYDAEKE